LEPVAIFDMMATGSGFKGKSAHLQFPEQVQTNRKSYYKAKRTMELE